MPIRPSFLSVAVVALAFAFVAFRPAVAEAQLVPGTGQLIKGIGDDFEDAEWNFVTNWPKSSKNLDHRERYPSGKSANGLWYEGMKRGQPDYIRRVATPAEGLPGSEGSLVLRSMMTGIPNSPSYRMQQDDFIANVMYKVGGPISASRLPSTVTRVYLPSFEKWEKRTGPTFAYRLAVDPMGELPNKDRDEPNVYWPGMLIDFESTADGRTKEDKAFFRIRANSYGGDYRAKEITQTGWWTLGMSITSDGRVHYYARPGVEDLRPEDRLASQYPYGVRARSMRTFFFNVLSRDDGRTWSTEWIVDDPMVYVAR